MSVRPSSWACVVTVILTTLAACSATSTKAEICPQCLKAAQECDSGAYDPLYENIEKDLAPWKTSGISGELMDETIKEFSILSKSYWCKGLGYVFKDGVVYTSHNLSRMGEIAHHKALHLAYMKVMYGLQQEYGSQLPDVEFLVHTSDDPTVPHTNGTIPMPVFRFCKSERFADILVPNFHFYMKRYDETILSERTKLKLQYPWFNKTKTLFGRFSPYKRSRNKDNSTFKAGYGGRAICDDRICHVRTHFMKAKEHLANLTGIPFDVAQQPKRRLLSHASFRYLLHLDGATCSSRLDQLLPLGSLVMKEESGYWAYYHHLLQPYKHYVPFWTTRPEDIAQGIKWAVENDSMAQQVAAAGQEVAERYLNKKVRSCYWYKLLHAYAKLQRFNPAVRGNRVHKELTPALHFIQGGGKAWVDRYKINFTTF